MIVRSSFLLLSVASVVLASACASSPQMPAGVKAGEFARLSCTGGRTFAVRMAEDGKSARVRAMHGAAELSLQPDGAYVGDEYTLAMPASAGSHALA